MEFIRTNLPYFLAGISTGGQYALIAIGYTMVYGVLRLINFAHGDIMMVGAYCALFAMTSLNLPFVFALILAVTVAVLLGVSTDKIAYKPLRSAPRISLLITAIGVSFLLENAFQVLYVTFLCTKRRRLRMCGGAQKRVVTRTSLRYLTLPEPRFTPQTSVFSFFAFLPMLPSFTNEVYLVI